LRGGHHVRVLPGAGDEEQDSAGNPGGARWQEVEGRTVAKCVGITGCQHLDRLRTWTDIFNSAVLHIIQPCTIIVTK